MAIKPSELTPQNIGTVIEIRKPEFVSNRMESVGWGIYQGSRIVRKGVDMVEHRIFLAHQEGWISTYEKDTEIILLGRG